MKEKAMDEQSKDAGIQILREGENAFQWKIRYHTVNLIQNQLMKEINCNSHLPGPTAKREGMMGDGGWRGRGKAMGEQSKDDEIQILREGESIYQ